MKVIKILLSLVVILVLLIAVGAIVFWQTFDITRYKPEITAQISKAIGRDTSISDLKLDLSFSRGATVNISRVIVADSADSGGGSFLEIDSVDLNVDIRSYLMKKEIRLSKIEINGPRAHVIRLEDGRLNIPVPPPSDEPADLSRLGVDLIHIKNGNVTFTDRSVDPPLTVPVDHLDLKVTHFAFDAPVNIAVQWGLFSPEVNFDAAGIFKVDQAFKDIRLEKFKWNSRLSAVSLEDLKKGAGSIPFVAHLRRLQGDISVDIPLLKAGASGLEKLSAAVDVKGFVLETPDIPVPVNNVNGQILLTEKDVELNNWTIPLASGMIDLKGKVKDYRIARSLSAGIKAEGLDIPGLMRMLPALVLPEGIGLAGTLRADVSVTGSAFNPDPAAVMASLTAQGTVAADQGVVQGYNLLQDLMTRLDKLSQIIGVGIKDQIEAKLPDDYKKKLDIKDTPIRKLEMVFNIKDQIVNFSDISLGVDEGSFKAGGSIDAAGNLSVAPEIFVSPALSEVFVRAVEDLAPLVGSDGRISIPLIPYKGPAAKVSCPPDTAFLIKKLGTGRIKKELKGVVSDTFGLPIDILNSVIPDSSQNKNSGTDASSRPQDSASSEDKSIKSRQESTPGQLIGGVLDKLLGQ